MPPQPPGRADVPCGRRGSRGAAERTAPRSCRGHEESRTRLSAPRGPARHGAKSTSDVYYYFGGKERSTSRCWRAVRAHPHRGARSRPRAPAAGTVHVRAGGVHWRYFIGIPSSCRAQQGNCTRPVPRAGSTKVRAFIPAGRDAGRPLARGARAGVFPATSTRCSSTFDRGARLLLPVDRAHAVQTSGATCSTAAKASASHVRR